MSTQPPDDRALAWARAAAAVLAKAGREVDANDPVGIDAALSAATAEGVAVPALGIPFLTPQRMAVTVGDGAKWDIVDTVEAGSLTTPGPGDRLVDGTVAADLGAGDTAELAYVLARATALLRLGAPDGEIEFRVAVTGEFFVTIAKLRALRVAWDRIRRASGWEPQPARVHAVTAITMMTAEDVHTNLLRTTAAALGAVVGGADALTVLPFDVRSGTPSSLGERLARNISHLLAGESFVTRDADAAAGAFALEELTRRMAAATWTEFQALDTHLAAVIADGSLTARWRAAGAQRDADIASGAKVVVGVNKYRAVAAS